MVNNNKKIPIDLIMFDFDGTLANSIPSAVKAVQQMIADLGFPYKTEEEINKHVGFGEVPLVSGSIGTEDPATVDRAMQVYFKHYLNEGIGGILLYLHVRETLEYFKSKKKMIISNKKDDFIKIILDKHDLSNYFIEILGGDSSPCLKPDPCTLLKALKEYNIPPDRAIFIGDMTVDVETGKNAKVWTCGVTYGFDGREKLAKASPDFIIDDIRGLENVIE
ncbi:MAG: HAD-IA family hydrolase [Candidatus Margulisiibacteriota bacterium]